MIWEGKRPGSEQEALELLEWHMTEYVEETTAEPTERILDFAQNLAKIWPDEASPWSTYPLTSDASGPFIQVSVQWNRAAEAAPIVAKVARDHRLVCIDGNGFIYSETSGIPQSIEEMIARLPWLAGEQPGDNGGGRKKGGLFGWFRR
jgi:hypothetical protein